MMALLLTIAAIFIATALVTYLFLRIVLLVLCGLWWLLVGAIKVVLR